MLMLPELEDSPDVIREAIERVARNSEKSEELSLTLSEFIESHRRLTVSYTGMGLIPSKALLFSLKALAPEREAYLSSASGLIFHYLPYIDDPGGVILFYGSPWERGELLRALDVLNLMDTSYLVIFTSPPDEIVEKKIPEKRSVIIPPSMGIIDHIRLAVSSGIMAAKRVTGREDPRIKRLREEIKDLSGLHEDLSVTYKSCLSTIEELYKDVSPIAILHSPSMEVPALLLQSLLINSNKVALIYDFSAAPAEAMTRFNPLALYTDVEEDAFKEINFRMLRRGVRPKSVKFSFDPVTGQLYASITLYAVFKRLQGQ